MEKNFHDFATSEIIKSNILVINILGLVFGILSFGLSCVLQAFLPSFNLLFNFV